MNLKSVFLILGMFAFSSQASNELVTVVLTDHSQCEVQLLKSITSSMKEQRAELMKELKESFEAELSKSVSNFVTDGLDVTNQPVKQLLSE